MPGFNQTMIEVKDATEVARDKVVEFSDEVTARLRGPVQNSLDELEKIIKGPEGQEDQALAAKLQRATTEIRRHSDALDELFHGNGQNEGLLTTVNRAGQNWETMVGEVTDGKSKALDEIEEMSKSLKNATDAIAASKVDIKKLGAASDKLGAASDSVNQFVDVVKSRPNSLVWGLNRDQKAKLSISPTRSSTTGAGKR
jgi:ABC-type transporter Mla subunit MlaD